MSPRIAERETSRWRTRQWRRRSWKHAHQFYDVGNWYVVAECWDLWAVLEELDRHEDLTQAPFELEAAAIGHFARIIEPRTTLH